MLLFGLSMDYEVFLLARIKQEWDRCGDIGMCAAAGTGGPGDFWSLNGRMS